MYCGCSISDKGIGIEGFLLEIDKNEQFLRAKLFLSTYVECISSIHFFVIWSK
jgi:hypothetical protein